MDIGVTYEADGEFHENIDNRGEKGAFDVEGERETDILNALMVRMRATMSCGF